jgi:predicted GNAT superfamily acetyltransferase
MPETTDHAEFTFVEVTAADFPALMALNESCVPNVNSIGLDEFREFREQAFCFLKLCDQKGQLAGFVIALTPGLSYQSVNYRWFVKTFESFLYIDRIMVHPSFRRRGVASRIYNRLESIARDESIPRLCCEVNLEPPNPESLKLHQDMGFRSAGTQSTEQGSKKVDLLVKPLT